MNSRYEKLLRDKMSKESYEKLAALNNPKLFEFVGEHVDLCEPETVYMCDDSDVDAEYIRARTLEAGEEKKLAKTRQTIHYDGFGDQGRHEVHGIQ